MSERGAVLFLHDIDDAVEMILDLTAEMT